MAIANSMLGTLLAYQQPVLWILLITVFVLVQEVKRRFPDGVPLLDPVADMKIKEEGFKVVITVRLSCDLVLHLRELLVLV